MYFISRIFHIKKPTQGIKCSNRSHGEAVGAVVRIQRIDVRRVEIQIAAVRSTVRNGSPVVAVRTDIVESAAIVRTITGGEGLEYLTLERRS